MKWKNGTEQTLKIAQNHLNIIKNEHQLNRVKYCTKKYDVKTYCQGRGGKFSIKQWIIVNFKRNVNVHDCFWNMTTKFCCVVEKYKMSYINTSI